MVGRLRNRVSSLNLTRSQALPGNADPEATSPFHLIGMRIQELSQKPGFLNYRLAEFYASISLVGSFTSSSLTSKLIRS